MLFDHKILNLKLLMKTLDTCNFRLDYPLHFKFSIRVKLNVITKIITKE